MTFSAHDSFDGDDTDTQTFGLDADGNATTDNNYTANNLVEGSYSVNILGGPSWIGSGSGSSGGDEGGGADGLGGPDGPGSGGGDTGGSNLVGGGTGDGSGGSNSVGGGEGEGGTGEGQSGGGNSGTSSTYSETVNNFLWFSIGEESENRQYTLDDFLGGIENFVAFAGGFGHGFFVDGAWGTAKGLKELLSSGFWGGSQTMELALAYYFYDNYEDVMMNTPMGDKIKRLVSWLHNNPWVETFFKDIKNIIAASPGGRGAFIEALLNSSPKTQEVLAGIADVMDMLTSDLNEYLEGLSASERSALLGRILGATAFEVATLGLAASAKSGKLAGRLGKILDDLPLSPAARKAIDAKIAQIFAKAKAPRRGAGGKFFDNATEVVGDNAHLLSQLPKSSYCGQTCVIQEALRRGIKLPANLDATKFARPRGSYKKDLLKLFDELGIPKSSLGKVKDGAHLDELVSGGRRVIALVTGKNGGHWITVEEIITKNGSKFAKYFDPDNGKRWLVPLEDLLKAFENSGIAL